MLMTTLRNPLELYVSGEQYLHREATSTLPGATRFITNTMTKALKRTPPPGFLHRFVGRTVMTPSDIRYATVEGSANLKTFWLVGVVEQYEGFIAVLRTLLDPLNRHADIWNAHTEKKLNVSPLSAGRVLATVDAKLVEDFNSTLSYQWLVYGHAVRLFTARCQEVLPEGLSNDLCRVPSPPAEYYYM